MSISKKTKKENKKKKTFYQAQIYIKGVRVKSRTFESKVEAFIWHEKEKRAFKNEPSESKKEQASHLFSDCLRLFERDLIPLLQKTSQLSYKYRLRYLTNSPLCSIRMDNFSAEHICAYILWLKTHTKFTKNSLRQSFIVELNFLVTVLSWYKNFVNADFNVPITKKHRKTCYYKSITPRRPDYFIKPEDVKKWIGWLKVNENPIFWRLAIFMVLTGVRVSEACGLCWDAVDLTNKSIKIIRVMKWDNSKKPFLVQNTKTKSSTRLIMLPDELVAILREMKEGDIDNNLVFKIRQKPLVYKTTRKVFTRGFKALGMPWSSTHILRHSYATIALVATKNISAVQASLGHKSIKTTEKYAKVVAALSRDTAVKTSRRFNLFGSSDLDDSKKNIL